MEVAASYPDNLDKIKMMTTTAKKKKKKTYNVEETLFILEENAI